MFSNVIVGIDGGPGGRDALALARHLADGHAEITLARVYLESPIATRAESSEFEAAERERSAELLEEARAAAGIDATLNPARSRSVGRGLHELAERVGADLIVVGSSSRGLVGRVLQGDDTRASLNGASCAVAVAPTHYADHASALQRVVSDTTSRLKAGTRSVSPERSQSSTEQGSRHSKPYRSHRFSSAAATARWSRPWRPKSKRHAIG
jgi:nucleotide-binding universal stress UspA family protein